MTGSALRWAALNLCCVGQPGLRRRLMARGVEAGGTPPLPPPVAESAGSALPPGRSWNEAAREELERARRFGAGVLTLEDASYPRLLLVSSDPPPLLYVWGRLAPEDALAIAVVGSRRATPHGVETARRIASGLAVAGFTVVSGLARGIDAASHRGALEAGGRTLAFLGSGLNRIYPAEHLKLAAAIAGRGAVLSEFPFGTPPLKRHFPERNRAIAWIAWATIVVEAARDSGSLITAGLAADEGRTVYAVPGPVGAPGAEGTNALLREGALVCRDASDVLEDLAPQLVEAARQIADARGVADAGVPGAARTAEDGRRDGAAGGAAAANDPSSHAAGLTPDERQALRHLPARGGIGIEALGRACGLPPGRLLAALLELELRGLVRQLPGRRFMSSG